MLKVRQGFTLIELLIVVVIIGILAAIAIPKFSKTREKAYFSAMKSDLKNLMSEEEIYYNSNNAYSYTTSQASLDFSPSSGVTVAGKADATGYAFTAVHAALDASTQSCGVFYGGEVSGDAAPATIAGVVTCKGE